MDDSLKEQYIKEIEVILKNQTPIIETNYPNVRDALQNGYQWPDIESLRIEGGLCLMFGLYQAAATVTNLFLETLLKIAIIYKTGWINNNDVESDVSGKVITYFEEKYEKVRKVMNANLGDNINRACKDGIITKDEKEVLHKIREKFRNALSHADKDKTFKDLIMPVTSMSITQEGIIEIGESRDVDIASLVVAHGPAQEEFCRREAGPYFLYIDSLARHIKNKLFPAE